MSADFPTLYDEPTITINGVIFPLAFDTDYVRQPMVPLAGSSAIGDASKQEDLLIPTFIISQWVNGIGLNQYDAAQGILAMADATLDLRNPNGIVLPPNDTLLGSFAVGPFSGPRHVEVLANPSDGHPKLFEWGRATGLAVTPHCWDLTTNTQPAITGLVVAQDFLNLADDYYATSGSAYAPSFWHSTDGFTWTSLSATRRYGPMCEFDGQIYAYCPDDKNTYAIQPSPFVATLVVTPPLLGRNEVVHQLFVYKDLVHGGDTVYMLTNRRIKWAELETQEWHDFGPEYDDKFAAQDPFVTVWDRDDNAYLTLYPATTFVMQDNGGTQDVVGPAKQGGLPLTGTVDSIAYLVQSVHWLYALGQDSSGVGGGRVLAMGEEQGWSTIYDAPAANPVRAFGYRAGTGYVMLQDGSLYSLDLPDWKGVLPSPTPGDYSTGLKFAETPWIDFGTPNRWDIAKWLVLDMIKSDQTLGVPVGDTVYIEYKYDSSPWRRIDIAISGGEFVSGTLLTESLAAGTALFPLVIPLPEPDVQTGVACHRFKLRVWMQRSSTATSPCLRSLQIAFLPWDEQRYSYQFLIDLTDDRFDEQPGRLYAGRGQEELRALLLQYAKDKRTYPVTFGRGAQETDVVGADFLVSAREDPTTGSGLYSVNFRDVGAPQSG